MIVVLYKHSWEKTWSADYPLSIREAYHMVKLRQMQGYEVCSRHYH